jgi:hypothetical protein
MGPLGFIAWLGRGRGIRKCRRKIITVGKILLSIFWSPAECTFVDERENDLPKILTTRDAPRA